MYRSRLFSSTLVAACLIGSAFSPASSFAQTATIEWLKWWGDADGVSADGSVVVGSSNRGATRWTKAGRTQDLGIIGNVDGIGGYARGVSADGGVVVGYSASTSSDWWRAFRWTAADGMQDLGTIGGIDSWSVARGVSADGSVVVGESTSPSGYHHAFRWTAAGGMQDLGTIGGVDGYSSANGISADGNVVVGFSSIPGNDGYFHAFRWTAAGGMQDLGTIGGDKEHSYANSVSDDGKVIVGTSGNRNRACIWINGNARSFQDLLKDDHGVDLGNGEVLWELYACSSDGRAIGGRGAGAGSDGNAFFVQLPPDAFVDREAPKIVPGKALTAFCDPGKLFATVKLTPPKATDNFPGKVTVTNNAKPPFKIGTTKVVWTATDVAGNKASWTQTVTVVNRAPKANAGKNVVVTTKSEKGVRVTLDGSKSSDPDKHKLTYAWSVPGVKLAPANSAKPSGVFKAGTKTVKLTVTDAAGAKSVATVKVTVKLKNGKARPRGSQANESFAAATRSAGTAVSGNATAASGFAAASIAASYGDAAGEFVRWEEGESQRDAEFSYAELRSLQQAYGAAAARSLFSAYAETGDESLFSAYGHAAWGTAFAAADLRAQ